MLAASGPATPSIAPLPNSSGYLHSFFSARVREEGRNLGASGGNRAERKADRGGAQPRRPRALPVLPRHPDRAGHLLHLFALPAAVGGHVQRLADREQPDRQHDDVDAVEQFRHTERIAHLPALLVDAHQPEQQADEKRRQPAHGRGAEHRGHGDEGEDHQREVLRRAEFQRDLDDDRRQQRQQRRWRSSRRRTSRSRWWPVPVRRVRPSPSCCLRARWRSRPIRPAC